MSPIVGSGLPVRVVNDNGRYHSGARPLDLCSAFSVGLCGDAVQRDKDFLKILTPALADGWRCIYYPPACI
jgi:hypothetical protein